MLTEDVSSAEKKRVNILEVALSLKKQNVRFRFFSFSACHFDVVAGILIHNGFRWTEMLFADEIMEIG